ncbi:DUF1036 domain-containing protein [Chloroflexi bacterium TSY]|nr:DUF1036 domain-containing protein [Chloroflexi bacterium TSY]
MHARDINESSYIYQILASECQHEPTERQQTGFRVKGITGIVTALHGVADCDVGHANPGDSSASPLRNLQIVQVDVRRDVVLLRPANQRLSDNVGLEPAFGEVGDERVHVIGYPHGVSSQLSTESMHTRRNPLRDLRTLVPPQNIKTLRGRGSPHPDIEVLSIEGHLVPGHSGAPIFNRASQVIGVGNGGLQGGATEIVWAIPWRDISWQTNIQAREALRKLRGKNPSILFAYPSEFVMLPSGHNFQLQNNCSESIRLALRYRQPTGEWRTEGWWTVDARKKTYLTTENSGRIKSNYHVFQYYARLANVGGISWSGDKPIEFQGKILSMRQQELIPNSEGNFVLSLSCPNIPSSSSTDYKVYIQNNCSHPIRVALRYEQLSEGWRTGGWWNIDANDGTYLSLNGERVRSNNHIFYYYAELPDVASYRWSGDEKVEFNGTTLSMIEKALSLNDDDDFVLSINCSNIPLPTSAGHDFYIQNNCLQSIRVALRYRHVSGQWRTRGWWNVDANDGIYLSSNGKRVRSNYHKFYYYAELPNVSGYRWSGDKKVEFNGTTLSMIEKAIVLDNDGKLVLSFNCPNIPSPTSAGHDFYIQNNCLQSIRVALRYRHLSGEWRTEGWWNVDAQEGIYLASDGQSIKSNYHSFYYYAELPNVSGYRWSGDKKVEFNGTTLSMIEQTIVLDDDGNFVLSFDCPNIPSPTSTGHDFYIQNNCSEAVRVALRYRHVSGQWRTGGWWNIDANDGTYLSLDGERVRSNNHSLYYYAELPNVSGYRWSGDEKVEFNGTTLSMIEQTIVLDDDGNFVLSFNCSNIPSPTSSGHDFYIQNNCLQSIRFALRYRHVSGQWRTRGWWNIDANDGTYLSSNGERVRSNYHSFYYYAELPDVTGYRWSGDKKVEFNGATLSMIEKAIILDDDGNFVLSFNCSNIPSPTSTGHDFYIQNNCSEAVRFALRYYHPAEGWRTEAWWNIDANDGTYLNRVSNSRVKSNNYIFYYYAESTEGGSYKWAGNEEFEFKKQTLPMKKITKWLNSAGDFVLAISCS